jgi:hypothetical protein
MCLLTAAWFFVLLFTCHTFTIHWISETFFFHWRDCAFFLCMSSIYESKNRPHQIIINNILFFMVQYCIILCLKKYNIQGICFICIAWFCIFQYCTVRNEQFLYFNYAILNDILVNADLIKPQFKEVCCLILSMLDKELNNILKSRC